MNKEFEEVNNLFMSRHYISGKQKLQEVSERYDELDEFSVEVKRLVSNTGKSMSINVHDLKILFDKFKIKLK